MLTAALFLGSLALDPKRILAESAGSRIDPAMSGTGALRAHFQAGAAVVGGQE